MATYLLEIPYVWIFIIKNLSNAPKRGCHIFKTKLDKNYKKLTDCSYFFQKEEVKNFEVIIFFLFVLVL